MDKIERANEIMRQIVGDNPPSLESWKPQDWLDVSDVTAMALALRAEVERLRRA